MKTIMTTAMKKIVTMMTTATKVNDDKAEEALHSMRTQLGLYSPQVFDPLICTIMMIFHLIQLIMHQPRA